MNNQTRSKSPRNLRRFAGLLFIGAVLGNTGILAADEPWPGLNPGPYAVGFRLIQTYDHSRTFKPKTDYFGERMEDERSRIPTKGHPFF